MSTKIECEYYECENLDARSSMEKVEEGGEALYVCSKCIDKIEDSTGYCNVYCICGYGCDGSC